MPVVTEIEYIPAEIRRIVEKLEQSLQLCDDEQDLEVWLDESDLAPLQDHGYWADYMNLQIVKQKQNITQNKENKLCQF